MYLIYIPISYIFKFILFILGWSRITEKQLSKISNLNKAVLLFSHTSYFDFWILILYVLAQPEILNDVYIVMKPQPFQNPIFKFFLEKLHFLPASRLEDKGSGFVNRISEFLNTKNTFFLLISPEGTIKANEWRTGYFYIAKATKSSIMVVGFDYVNKCLSLGKNDYIPSHFSDIIFYQTSLQYEMSEIVPYNIHNSSVPITVPCLENSGFINWKHFIYWMINVILLYKIYSISKIICLLRLGFLIYVERIPVLKDGNSEIRDYTIHENIVNSKSQLHIFPFAIDLFTYLVLSYVIQSYVSLLTIFVLYYTMKNDHLLPQVKYVSTSVYLIGICLHEFLK